MDRTPEPVNRTSSSQAKIALFRSLFRGREDVYPRRFESRKTGKSGYAPACANEWVRGICEKPRIKCAECPNRRFLPVTDDVIRWHLSGRDDAGRAVRRWRLSAAPGRDVLLPGRRFRQGRLAARMPRRFSKRAAAWIFQPPSSGRARDEAGTSGSSSRRPFRPRWRDGSARTS